MQIVTKANAKTAASALRRELSVLGTTVSHNQCLTLLAKTMGFTSWNAMEALLLTDASAPVVEPQTAAAPVDAPKYPLVNTGDFDFVEKGEHGIAYFGNFYKMEGTFEKVQGRGEVSATYRSTKSGESPLIVCEVDDTTMFWDTGTTQEDEQGHIVFLGADGGEYSGAQCILVPDGVVDPYHTEELPVREKLVEAYVEYFREQEIAPNAFGDMSQELFHTFAQKVAKVVGFRLTKREELHFLSVYSTLPMP